MNKNKKKLSLKKMTIETLAGSPNVAGGSLPCTWASVSCPDTTCRCGGESPSCNCYPCVAGY